MRLSTFILAATVVLSAGLAAGEEKDPQSAALTAALDKLGESDASKKDGDDAKAKTLAEDALAQFRAITKDTESRLYGMAQFNTGVVLCDYLARYEDALKEFKTLIDSKVNDKDDTGMLMTPFRNYRHHAWRMMSICHERLQKQGLALEDCYQMRKSFVTHCNTCLEGANKYVSSRAASVCKGLVGTEAAPKAADVDALMVKHASAGELLLTLGKQYRADKKNDHAIALLKTLCRDFPASESALAAEAALEEMKAGK